MKASHSRSKRLRFESLEPKVLLAADLHAAVVDGDLVVVGSKGDDDLLIEASNDTPGAWTITPVAGDSINGHSPGEAVTVSGVSHDLWVSLRDGNDKVTIKGASQPGDSLRSLHVRGRLGTNQILVSDILVGNDLSIRTRADSDDIVVQRVEVADQLVIRSGAGADSVTCDGLTVGGSLDVHAGGGWYDDTMSVTNTTVEDDFSFCSSRGDNELIVGATDVGNRTRVRLGEGADHVQFGYLSPESSIMGPPLVPENPTTSVHTRQLQIQTNGGEDDVDVYHAVVSRHLRAYLGGDSDQMRIIESTIGGNSIVDGDTGDDLLEAGTSYAGELYSAGNRDGTLYFTSPWPFAGETSFDGGDGEDTLRFERDAEVDQDDRYWKSWENIFDNHFGSDPAQDANGTGLTASDAVNQFAADLYHALADSEENLAFSPLSISAALAMLYAGAHGNTADEMAEVLHFPESTMEFHAEYGALLDSLNEAGQVEELDLNVANSLWGQIDFPFSQDFLDLILTDYNGGLNDVDFVNETEAARQAINQWVEDQTEDKIQDLIPPGVLTEETVLVLANAIYFDAKWTHQFEPDRTQVDRFDVSADEEIFVDMMHDTTYCNYMQRDGVQYLELPYSDGRFSMLLALPAEGTPLSQIDVTAMTDDLDEFLSGLVQQRVAVSLPKFEITSTPNVKQTLIDLGMEDLFHRDASNLDGMKDPDAYLPGNLWVQDVRHKAFIELDEAGTTAAAATAVTVGYTSSVPPEPTHFSADHPFQYFIQDTQTDTILFMGHVGRPTEAEPLAAADLVKLEP